MSVGALATWKYRLCDIFTCRTLDCVVIPVFISFLIILGGVAVVNKAEQERCSPPVKVQGCKAHVQERKKLSRMTSEPLKKTKPGIKSVKIRNYNIKD